MVPALQQELDKLRAQCLCLEAAVAEGKEDAHSLARLSRALGRIQTVRKMRVGAKEKIDHGKKSNPSAEGTQAKEEQETSADLSPSDISAVSDNSYAHPLYVVELVKASGVDCVPAALALLDLWLLLSNIHIDDDEVAAVLERCESLEREYKTFQESLRTSGPPTTVKIG